MKKLLFVYLIFLLPVWGEAQSYGNEWINYNQLYYKFGITNDGIYRISYQDMAAAGIPVSGISPSQFQIFGKEKELPLYVNDGADGSFDFGDYVEFFAEGNDGWRDSILYDDPNKIGNPGYSLYNDTLFYFLTWTTGATKRFVIESDVNYAIYTPAPFVLQNSDKNYNVQYYGGESTYSAYSSFYVEGEGWGGPNLNGVDLAQSAFTVPISTPVPYTGINAPDVKFHAKSNGNSNAQFDSSAQGNHHMRWELGSGNILFDSIYIGYKQIIADLQFSPSSLTNGNTNFTFRIVDDQGALTDYQSVSYLSLIYPRIPDLNNSAYADFRVLNSSTQAKIRLDLVNATLTNPSMYVFGGTVSRRIPLTQNGAIWQCLIPNVMGSNEQRVVIASSTQIFGINGLQPVNGTGSFTDFSLQNPEEAYLVFYNKAMQTSVSEYAVYRGSWAGGGHNVILCEIEDVCMQFGGGITKHILGVRRLANMIYDLSNNKPLGMIFLGKGVREASEPNTSSANSVRKNSNVAELNLVPSFGYPSSDVCVTNKWNGSQSWAPAIPTGRIAARNNQELLNYLNKLKVYELQQNQNAVYNKPAKEWQKQILHFGGGGNASEQLTFRNYLNGMKATIEGEYFGGNVHSYFKQSSSPFNPVLTTEVNEFLENGVSLMTFFGHATANGFDQSIDEPENWNNIGKYPMVIGNGCYTGDIFQPSNSTISESFVLLENLGAIGFLSSTKLGFANQLNTYTSELYRQMSPEAYGSSIGEQIKRTIAGVEGSNNNFLTEMTVTQMVLHGDPVMRLNWHAKPEIDLTVQDVYFEPSQVDLTTDSITVNVILTNLGQSIIQPFSLVVERDFPSSSTDSVYVIQVPRLDYRDTIAVRIPLQPEIGSGMNEFNISVDIPSFIEEQYDEFGNNQISVNYFINIDGIIPVLPYDYAVVPEDSVVLKASTVNPLAGFNSYRFEIDTTDLFNSPFRKYAVKSGLGGVKEVFPGEWLSISSNASSPLILQDSISYFWRVAVDSTSPQWVEHSFQFIPGKEGWGQDHFFQFKNGTFSGVEYDRVSRQRNFEASQGTVSCDVFDNASNSTQWAQTLWRINGQIAEYDLCGTDPSLHVAVIDPTTMEPWGTFNNGVNPDHQFGNVNNGAACRNRVEYYFIFRQNSTAQLQALENMLVNEIPNGHYVLIYSTIRGMFSNWTSLYPNLYTTLQNLGSDSLYAGRDDRAFIFLTRKGDPSFTQETVAQQPGDFISLNAILQGATDFGMESSTVIGPAAEWNTLYWKQSPSETPTDDFTRLRIQGLNWNKAVITEIDTLFSQNDSILNLNNLLPASQYPYLRLQARYSDTTGSTPAQVDRWHVLYQPLPEAAIDGSNGYVFTPVSPDSLQEGVTVSFAVDVRNISHLDMDSLLIHYWVSDENQNIHPIPYQRQDSLRAGETLRDTVSFSSENMAGTNTLWMEVNPYVNGLNNSIKDQPELAHFNNLLQIPFTLDKDDLNPILDVTFDGMHILNGDIVNPNAEILITLKDDNPFLVMDQDSDTSYFGIFLTDPSGVQKRIPFLDQNGNQVLQWIPADESNLKFKIIYTGNFTHEGEYELLVQGSDKSSNLSGDMEYRVNFEVILGSSITHMMNYPNPFSTSTRFVFTLTGSKVPDEIIIQVMTVTGRIVREITEDEIGPIRIGRNITEFAWDGRDEFGDQLANGVYLYRVKAQIDGESIEHRSSGADRYFEKNWGKMYLMR
ncbi:MAG: C25 family cysteine peptidase [Brumimicrobium sp.]|nr:C25 family cysteine peptidase [Brumimicrobium sp.]